MTNPQIPDRGENTPKKTTNHFNTHNYEKDYRECQKQRYEMARQRGRSRGCRPYDTDDGSMAAGMDNGPCHGWRHPDFRTVGLWDAWSHRLRVPRRTDPSGRIRGSRGGRRCRCRAPYRRHPAHNQHSRHRVAGTATQRNRRPHRKDTPHVDPARPDFTLRRRTALRLDEG